MGAIISRRKRVSPLKPRVKEEREGEGCEPAAEPNYSVQHGERAQGEAHKAHKAHKAHNSHELAFVPSQRRGGPPIDERGQGRRPSKAEARPHTSQDGLGMRIEPLSHPRDLAPVRALVPVGSTGEHEGTGSDGAGSDADSYFDSEELQQMDSSDLPRKLAPRPSTTEDGLTSGPPVSWRRGEMIGHGGYGQVYCGLNTVTGELMAVKEVPLLQSSVRTTRGAVLLQSIEAEIQLLRMLHHPNIVHYLGTSRTTSHLNIFLEYVSGGSIASLLKRFGPFDEGLLRVYTRQLLEGLHYLHTHNIVHRDIKGANILVTNNGVCKLADFGAARRLADLADNGHGVYSLHGTPYWMAPEVVKQTGHGRKADIWSVGCTVYEMATGHPPWHRYTHVAALYHIAVENSLPELPSSLSDHARDFITQCLTRDARARPNVKKLLQHPFVADVAATGAEPLRSVFWSSPNPPLPPSGSPRPQSPDSPPGYHGHGHVHRYSSFPRQHQQFVARPHALSFPRSRHLPSRRGSQLHQPLKGADRRRSSDHHGGLSAAAVQVHSTGHERHPDHARGPLYRHRHSANAPVQTVGRQKLTQLPGGGNALSNHFGRTNSEPVFSTHRHSHEDRRSVCPACTHRQPQRTHTQTKLRRG